MYLHYKAKLKLLNGCLAVVVVLSSTLTPMFANAATSNVSSSVTRLGGADQYETAALMAQKGWSGVTDSVVLSAGMNYTLVDALAAGPLAAKLKAPILLTDGGESLNSFAKTELQRLKPKTVYLTSGVAVIKPSVIAEIKALGITTVQLGGYDQYETSVNIAKELTNQGVNVFRVVLAAGWLSPADALSVASIAAAKGMPILTTTQGRLPDSVKTYLDSIRAKVTDSYVVGGSAVVSEAVQGQLPGQVSRYAGATKYDTNVQILKGFANEYNNAKVYVANGETLVDALAGVPLAAADGAPVVLVHQPLDAAIKDYVKLNMSTAEMVVLGGEAVVPAAVLNALTSTPTGGGGPTTPTNPDPVTISNLQVITEPSNSLGTFNNGAIIDLSGLDDSVKVLGVGLTADQSCTFSFKIFNQQQSISLVAGQQTLTAADLFLGGTQVDDGVTLGDFRSLYTTRTLTGQLLHEDGTSAGTLTIKMRFKK